jgi:hypothetical protein
MDRFLKPGRRGRPPGFTAPNRPPASPCPTKACHHAAAIVSRPLREPPIMAARRGRDQPRGEKNRRAKGRADRAGGSANGTAMSALRQRPICGLRGWDSPIPSSLPRTPIRGADLIGSRVRPGCRGSGSAPEPAVVTESRREQALTRAVDQEPSLTRAVVDQEQTLTKSRPGACRGTAEPVFRYGHAHDRRISGRACRRAPGE